MPVILTPALALRHLRQLSTDVRRALVLDAAGDPLAGDAEAAAQARELHGVLAGVANADELVVRLERDGELRGWALALAGDAHVLVVAAGPHAPLALLRHDLRTFVGDLSGRPAETSPAVPQPPALPSDPVAAFDASNCLQRCAAADSAGRTAIFAGMSLIEQGRTEPHVAEA